VLQLTVLYSVAKTVHNKSNIELSVINRNNYIVFLSCLIIIGLLTTYDNIIKY